MQIKEEPLKMHSNELIYFQNTYAMSAKKGPPLKKKTHEKTLTED